MVRLCTAVIRRLKIVAAVSIASGILLLGTASGQYPQPAPVMAPQNVETAIVESSTQVLNEIMAAPRREFPARCCTMPRRLSLRRVCSRVGSSSA